MYPAIVPWTATDTGAQAQLGHLGLLIVRKVRTDMEVIVLGKVLRARSLTLDDGKMRAEAAARKWVAEATEILWTKDKPEAPLPTWTTARPGGIAKRGVRLPEG